jgi:hypothetical protein
MWVRLKLAANSLQLSSFPHPLLKIRYFFPAYQRFFINNGFQLQDQPVPEIIIDLINTIHGNIE